MKSLFTVFIIGLMAQGSIGFAQDQKQDPGVDRTQKATMLIQLKYDSGRWSAQPLEALPCGSPSKPEAQGPTRSQMRLVDDRGRVLFERFIIDPRIILVEDPREPPKLLEQLEFVVAVPMQKAAARFEFFEKELQREAYVDARDPSSEPSVAVDLGKAVRAFYEGGGLDRKADCQIARPDLERLPPLDQEPGNALTVAGLTALVASDQGLLMERGLEMGLAPDEVQKLIYSYRSNWGDVNVNEEQVKAFLERYDRFYRAAADREAATGPAQKG